MRLLRRAVLALVAWRLAGPVVHPMFRAPQEHPWRLPGRTVFVGDEEFLVREAGPEDSDPILLIHGLGGSSLGEWYLIGPKLATSHRVIMIDHRSHGLSRDVHERYEIEDVADDLAGVLDVLGIGAVTAVGYSMGGAIAQALAHRHPGRVSKMVLIATFASHPEKMRFARWLAAMATRGWERLTGIGTPEVRSGYLLTTGAVEPKHARWLWEETHRRHPDSGAQATLSLLRFDSRKWVGRVEADAMVVIPAKDLLVPTAWQYELAGLIPGCRVVELAGARHEVVWTHAERILEELYSFLG